MNHSSNMFAPLTGSSLTGEPTSMMNHDNGNAIVEANSGESQVSNVMTMAMPLSGMGQSPVEDVLKGGLSGSWLYHSLRRRWMLALFMSLLLSSIVAILLYAFLPETYSAEAQYKIASTPLTLIDGGSTNQTKDYEIFQNTQIASILGQYVLQEAVRPAEISQLGMFKGVDDQVAWLQSNVTVNFPRKGEILSIKMSGPYPAEDLKKVVESISRSYFEGSVFAERRQRRQPLEVLQSSLGGFTSQLRDKMEKYHELARDAGTSDTYQDGFDPETKFLLTEVSQLQSKRGKLESQLAEVTMNFRIFEKQITDPAYQEQMVDQALQGDPNIAQMKSELMGIEMEIRSSQSTVRGGTSAHIRRLESQRSSLSQQIAQMREQLRVQISGERSNEPNPLLKSESTSFQITQAMISQQMKSVDERMDTIKTELLQKVTKNLELTIRKAEIEQLEAIKHTIGTKIQNIKIELSAPARIVASGTYNENIAAKANTSQNRNTTMRYALSGLGGMSIFGLTCFGIGYMEFTKRRLNGAEQVDEGLGIRVIGTLPSLSGRKALNPKHPVVAQLNESIDSVRTSLMHDSTSKPRQVVLVTSPVTGDGRTTVASQLAASLARAGRRTLLIDGDLRHPALHTLFNTPLEDGVSEILRAEANVTDAIRPTEAEGLWLLTAGYCCSDATQALASDDVKAIFEKLRAEYDFIIIDGAPVLGVTDSLLVGQHCDGAILSVLRDHTSVPAIHKASEALKSVGIRMIGAVINGVQMKADSRVTHLQQVTPKSERRKLESVGSAE